MDDTDRRVVFTDRDLTRDFNPAKLDRIGPPIGVEEHKVDAPEEAKTSQARSHHTLLDMSKEFEFFTTGVIHATTIFDRDPIAEFNNRFPADSNDDLPMAIDYANPFFKGLGVGLISGMPVNLDHRLYAIRRHRWEAIRNCICGIAMMHRSTAFYAKLAFYEMEIVDPFALKKMTVVTKVPSVPITVFAVSSNKSFSYLQAAQFPELPSLVNEPPKPEIVAEGKGVLGPPGSPESLLPKKGKP